MMMTIDDGDDDDDLTLAHFSGILSVVTKQVVKTNHLDGRKQTSKYQIVSSAVSYQFESETVLTGCRIPSRLCPSKTTPGTYSS